jgi:protein TonB
MPLVLAFAAALAAQSAPEATPRDAPAGFADAPDWLRLPTQAEKLAVYPRAALARRIAGQAAIDCVLDADGYLRGCRVSQESPSGLGFGEAALALAADFRMSPLTPAGATVEGARVSVPISFAPASTRASFRLR